MEITELTNVRKSDIFYVSLVKVNENNSPILGNNVVGIKKDNTCIVIRNDKSISEYPILSLNENKPFYDEKQGKMVNGNGSFKSGEEYVTGLIQLHPDDSAILSPEELYYFCTYEKYVIEKNQGISIAAMHNDGEDPRGKVRGKKIIGL
jgi:hypothetical protein